MAKELLLNLKWNTGIAQLTPLEKVLTALGKGQQDLENKTKAFGKTGSESFSKVGNEAKNTNNALGKFDWGAKGLNNLSNSAKSAMGILSTLGRSAKQVAGLMAGVFGFGGLGVTGIIGKGLSDYSSFSKQVNLMMTALMPGVGATQTRVKDMMEKQLRASAVRLGADPGTMAQGMYQLLSMPGMTPDANLANTNPAKYQKQLDNVSGVLEKVTNFAQSQNADPLAIMQNYLHTATAMGLDPSKITSANDALDLFGVAVTHGITTFDQLAGQFIKIQAPAQRAGVSLSQATALVLAGTMSMGSEGAGEGAKAFLTKLADPLTYTSQIKEKMTSQIAAAGGGLVPTIKSAFEKSIANKNYKGAASILDQNQDNGAMMTGAQLLAMSKLTDQGYLNTLLVKAQGQDRVKNALDLYSGADKYGATGKMIVQSALSGEENVGQLLNAATGNDKSRANYEDILKQMDEVKQVQELGDKLENNTITAKEYQTQMDKISVSSKMMTQYNQSFGHSWDSLSRKIQDVSLTVGSAFSPAMSAVVSVLNGSDDPIDTLNAGFGETHKRLEAIMPGLGSLGDIIQDVVKWFSSGAAADFFKKAQEGAKDLFNKLSEMWTALKPLVLFLSNLVVEHPVAVTVSWLGVSALGPLVTSVVSSAVTAAFMKSGATGLAGTAAGGAGGAGTGVAGAAAATGVAAVLGVGIIIAGVLAGELGLGMWGSDHAKNKVLEQFNKQGNSSLSPNEEAMLGPSTLFRHPEWGPEDAVTAARKQFDEEKAKRDAEEYSARTNSHPLVEGGTASDMFGTILAPGKDTADKLDAMTSFQDTLRGPNAAGNLLNQAVGAAKMPWLTQLTQPLAIMLGGGKGASQQETQLQKLADAMGISLTEAAKLFPAPQVNLTLVDSNGQIMRQFSSSTSPAGSPQSSGGLQQDINWVTNGIRNFFGA